MRSRNIGRVTAAVLGLLALPWLVACGGDGGPSDPEEAGPPTISCAVSRSSIVAGDQSGVTVTALVTRGGNPSVGTTVNFATTLGSVTPVLRETGSDGRATTTFTSSGQTGTAVITSQVFSGPPEDHVGSSCLVTVTPATDPQVSVTVLSPQQLAGIDVDLTYDPAEVSLRPGGATAQGTVGGTDCFQATNDTTGGSVTLTVACATQRVVGGSVVARFAFDNSSLLTVDEGDFDVTCQGFNEAGQSVATTCVLSVTQT